MLSKPLISAGKIERRRKRSECVADNAHLVRDTLMPHVSISDPAEQIYLVAYLKTLKGPATP
jgi:hypothetical protein